MLTMIHDSMRKSIWKPVIKQMQYYRCQYAIMKAMSLVWLKLSTKPMVSDLIPVSTLFAYWDRFRWHANEVKPQRVNNPYHSVCYHFLTAFFGRQRIEIQILCTITILMRFLCIQRNQKKLWCEYWHNNFIGILREHLYTTLP